MSASPVIGLQRCVRSTESPFGMKPDSSAPPLPLPWRPRAVGQLHLSWRSWLSSSQPPPAWPRQPAVGFWVKGGGRRGGPTARRQGSTWSWCVVQDLVALRQRVVAWCQGDTAQGPTAHICWDRTWESTVEPTSPPSHFFFQKMANVNKLSVHMCFGIWMETLVCAPPPALLPLSLSVFAKWAFLAQPQLNLELFGWYFPHGLITNRRSGL